MRTLENLEKIRKKKKRAVKDFIKYGGASILLVGSSTIFCWETDKIKSVNYQEIELFKNTAAYVEQYKGNNPQDILEYVQKTITLAKENDSLKEDMSKLEKALEKAYSVTTNSKNIGNYQLSLEDTKRKIIDVLNNEVIKKEKEIDGYDNLVNFWVALVSYFFPFLTLIAKFSYDDIKAASDMERKYLKLKSSKRIKRNS